jgi:hypothetical protein
MSIVLAPPLLAELLLLLLLVPLLQPTAAKAMTINAAIAVVRPIVFLSILGCPAATERAEGSVAPVRLSSATAPGQGADAGQAAGWSGWRSPVRPGGSGEGRQARRRPETLPGDRFGGGGEFG